MATNIETQPKAGIIRPFSSFAGMCGMCIVLLSCSQSEVALEVNKPGSYFLRGNDHTIIDPDLNFSRKKFKDNLLPKTQAKQGISDEDDDAEPAIPEISELLIAPKPPQIGEGKLISLSVTENIPLKDVLLEIARLADIDIELDPNIEGGIILRVKEKPLNEVIERIANLADLRYSFENGMLRVQRDIAYVKNYKLDFLNLTRSSKTNSTINTAVVSEVDEASQVEGSVETGTNSTLTSEYNGDLWDSITRDVANILGLDPNDPTGKKQASALSQDASNLQDLLSSSTTGSNVELADDSKKQTKAKNFLSINKQAGLITIRGTDKQHKSIDFYLNKARKSVSAQVLIEAKIVEVSLNQDYRTGIDWNLIDENIRLSGTGGFTENIIGESDLFTVGILNGARTNLETAISMTESFGTSRTLSSPRLHAMNNQQAVLSFATNEVYFTLDVQEERSDQLNATINTLNIDSEIHTVPIGIILNLQPSINLDTNEITMNVRPTLSRITGRIDDPGVSILAARNNAGEVSSSIPVVEVKELDSILKIQSGQVMVIGGLMEERNANDEKGIPVISNFPLVGKLFKGSSKQSDVIETVIFIKATIVPGYGVSDGDKHLYRTFMRDPRPLTF